MMLHIGECLVVSLLLASCGWFAPSATPPTSTTEQPAVSQSAHRLEKVKLEADHIVACQYLEPQDMANGAINDVCGDPTWVVPGEMAVAILGLVLAADMLDDPLYLQRAQLAADFLVRVQLPDGAWCDKYDHQNCIDASESARHPAQVMMALFELGYDPGRYAAMSRAAQFLLDAQQPSNKGGDDDGLVGGGKDAEGRYHNWRWTSDNAYAYWALRMAALWASRHEDPAFADTCAEGARRILDGIENTLFDPATGVWNRAVDGDGRPQDGAVPSWIQYSPCMLEVPATACRTSGVYNWIHLTFQQPDGSCIEYIPEGATIAKRESPGFSFQCALAFLQGSQTANAQAAIDWAESGGLWETGATCDDCPGGFVDWLTHEPPARADCWQRFIDTSAYAIMAWTGGYAVGLPAIYLPMLVK